MRTIDEAPYQWGFIFGTQCSDGWKPRKSKYSIEVGLSGIDREYLELYRRYVYDITGKLYKISPVNKVGQYRIRILYRPLVDFIRSSRGFGTFTWRIPDFIMNGCFEIKRGFLNAFFDGDGWPYRQAKHPALGFRSSNTSGLEDIKVLLSGIEIHSVIYPDKNDGCNSLLVYRLEDAKRYFREIGISLSRKRRVFEELLALREATVACRSWEAAEIQILRDNYRLIPNSDLAVILSRSISGIRYKAQQLHLVNPRWTKEQEKFVIEHRDRPRYKLAEAVGKTRLSVTKKINRLAVTIP